MDDKSKAMVLASFIADSLSMGVHWIYDTDKLARDFGTVDSFLKPDHNAFHSKRDRGEHTHYGDQAFVLLESLAVKMGFELDDFSRRWQGLFKDYDGYYDKATKATLDNLSRGMLPQDAGSSSSDLAGASRLAPLVFLYRDDLEALLVAAKTQTQMTHNDPAVIDSAEFFSRVSWMVLRGRTPLSAMEETAAQQFQNSPLLEWVEEGIRSKDAESIPTITRFGQSCHTAEAFPGIVHLAAKYERDLPEALIQAAMAGGDSAARGMAVGMILGAHLGEKSIPEHWLSGLKRREEILTFLDQIG